MELWQRHRNGSRFAQGEGVLGVQSEKNITLKGPTYTQISAPVPAKAMTSCSKNYFRAFKISCNFQLNFLVRVPVLRGVSSVSVCTWLGFITRRYSCINSVCWPLQSLIPGTRAQCAVDFEGSYPHTCSFLLTLNSRMNMH